MIQDEFIKKTSDDYVTSTKKLNEYYTEFQGFSKETTYKITNKKLTFKNNLKEIIEFCNTWESVPNDYLKSSEVINYLSNELVKHPKLDYQTKRSIMIELKNIISPEIEDDIKTDNKENEISEIDKLKEQIKLLNDALRSQEQTIKKQNDALRSQEQTIENLKKQINQEDSSIIVDDKDKKIREQNKLIRQLKDIIIRQDGKIKELQKQQKPGQEQQEQQLSIYGIPLKKKTKPTCKDDIPQYERKHKYLLEKITTKHGNMYRLKVIDYKRQSDNNMEYLNELNIEKNPNTNKYELTFLQVEKLIEKIILNDKLFWD